MGTLDRARFLSAGSAALLSACGHAGGSSSLLPATNAATHLRAGASTAASPIPAHVLQFPIIGEARRFDGSTAPPGWMLMGGQTMPTAQNRALAAIVDNVHAMRSTTFTIPAAPGWIIAVSGAVPASPRALASLQRGANPNHGVSIESMTVRDAPPAAMMTQHREAPVPSWYPGTVVTSAQLKAQDTAASGR